MISYHFLNQTSRDNFFTNDTGHGAGQLWHDIPLVPAFADHQTPFPVIMSDSRPVGSNLTTRLGPQPVVYEVRATPSNRTSIQTDSPGFRFRFIVTDDAI